MIFTYLFLIERTIKFEGYLNFLLYLALRLVLQLPVFPVLQLSVLYNEEVKVSG